MRLIILILTNSVFYWLQNRPLGLHESIVVPGDTGHQTGDRHGGLPLLRDLANLHEEEEREGKHHVARDVEGGADHVMRVKEALRIARRANRGRISPGAGSWHHLDVRHRVQIGAVQLRGCGCDHKTLFYFFCF